MHSQEARTKCLQHSKCSWICTFHIVLQTYGRTATEEHLLAWLHLLHFIVHSISPFHHSIPYSNPSIRDTSIAVWIFRQINSKRVLSLEITWNVHKFPCSPICFCTTNTIPYQVHSNTWWRSISFKNGYCQSTLLATWSENNWSWSVHGNLFLVFTSTDHQWQAAHRQYKYGQTMSSQEIPYTRVNKRICLFSKLQGNMCLLPNTRLIMKGKNWPHPQNRDTFGSTCTWQHTRQVIRTRKLSVLTWWSPWNLQTVWAVMPWQTLVLVLMRTADVDEELSCRDHRYCTIGIR